MSRKFPIVALSYGDGQIEIRSPMHLLKVAESAGRRWFPKSFDKTKILPKEKVGQGVATSSGDIRLTAAAMRLLAANCCERRRF
ncbi:unnamed protein product [Citrullus colocynthis]|uniref:Uncharacterized protein n=1 Tax=Citrullus colocynthis TaxID=252529 RepID=A0ABP0XNN1_9ROSI